MNLPLWLIAPIGFLLYGAFLFGLAVMLGRFAGFNDSKPTKARTVLTPADHSAFLRAVDATEPTEELVALMKTHRGNA